MTGKLIRKYLDDKGIKVSWLAEKSGMTFAALNETLKGNRRLEADEYYNICMALGLPLEYFHDLRKAAEQEATA